MKTNLARLQGFLSVLLFVVTAILLFASMGCAELRKLTDRVRITLASDVSGKTTETNLPPAVIK